MIASFKPQPNKIQYVIIRHRNFTWIFHLIIITSSTLRSKTPDCRVLDIRAKYKKFHLLAENQNTKYVHKFQVQSASFSGLISSLSSHLSAPSSFSAPLATNLSLKGISWRVNYWDITDQRWPPLISVWITIQRRVMSNYIQTYRRWFILKFWCRPNEYSKLDDISSAQHLAEPCWG